MDEKSLKQFLEKGWTAVRGAVPKDVAAKRAKKALEKAKNPKDEAVFVPGKEGIAVKELSPKAWAAICELVGGAERLAQGDLHSWSEAYSIRFTSKEGPGAIDGNWSLPEEPNVGLTTVVLWTDCPADGGGLAVACDSLPLVAKAAGKVDPAAVAKQCKDIVRLEGKAGDVFLIHPYVLVSETGNARPEPLVQTIRHVDLAGPLKPTGKSHVERALKR